MREVKLSLVDPTVSGSLIDSGVGGDTTCCFGSFRNQLQSFSTFTLLSENGNVQIFSSFFAENKCMYPTCVALNVPLFN